MRKKCVSCGLIAFANDEFCRRCGSEKIFKYPEPDELPKAQVDSKANVPFWNYLICFIVACVFEFIALLPILADLGTRHSAAASVSDSDRMNMIFVFILHLPTSIFAYYFGSFHRGFLLLNAPFIQIIFWTITLSILWRKRKMKMS